MTTPKQPEKCTCWDDLLEGAKKQLAEKYPEHKNMDIRWKDYSFFLNAEVDYSPVNPKLIAEYSRTKKDGTQYANLTKEEVTVTAEYCCHCGRKLGLSNKSGAAA